MTPRQLNLYIEAWNNEHDESDPTIEDIKQFNLAAGIERVVKPKK